MKIKGIVSVQTTVNKKEYQFLFPNGIDIKDTTEALANIHTHLIKLVEEQNKKAQEDANKKVEEAKSKFPQSDDSLNNSKDEIKKD